MDCTAAVYEHAAFLIGRSPWEASRDAELLRRGHAAAFRLYRHTPVVVSIDIYNLEAEAYGAAVRQPVGCGVPAIVEPLCGSLEALAQLDPFDPSRAGRVPMTIDAAARLAAELPEADVRVPMAGPMSLATNLMGVEPLLREVATRPEAVRDALMHLVEGQVGFCRAVVEAGLDVAFFESAAAPPLLSPRQFRSVELPALGAMMEALGGIVGHPLPCVMGGDTAPILGALLETGTGYLINPIETDQAAFMRKLGERTDVRVRINASPGIIAGGTREALRGEARRIAALAAGRENVCAGTGALPYETPPENVLFFQQVARSLG
jgi:uroporphyrinogen decarboxylase